MTIKETIEKMRESDLFVFDVDNCIVEGRIASSPISVMMDELDHGDHIDSVYETYGRGVGMVVSVMEKYGLLDLMEEYQKKGDGLKDIVRLLGLLGIDENRIEEEVKNIMRCTK